MNAPIIRIGGEVVTLPPTYFDKLEACADLISALAGENRRVHGAGILLRIAAILAGKDVAQTLARSSLAEAEALQGQWADIMVWAGLVTAAQGEALATSLLPSASET